MNEIQALLGLHSIIDWLTVIALLLAGVIVAIACLGLSVSAQFAHHDRDLRAEVERASELLRKILSSD